MSVLEGWYHRQFYEVAEKLSAKLKLAQEKRSTGSASDADAAYAEAVILAKDLITMDVKRQKAKDGISITS
jgi:hypothetical protein